MNQLPDIDRKKLIWPEPTPRTLLGILKDGVWIIVGILAVLAAWSAMMTKDANDRAEDAERRVKKANDRTATLMNGRPLVDLENRIAFVPSGRVIEVSVK